MTQEYKSTLEMLVEPNKNLFRPINTDKIPDNVKKEFLKEINKNIENHKIRKMKKLENKKMRLELKWIEEKISTN